MSQPIYKVYLVKANAAYYELTQEERNEIGQKTQNALKKVGAETVVMCNSVWASENFQFWGVEKFPDIEAAQKHAQLLLDLDWHKYVDVTSYLGTEWPGS